MVSPSDDWSLSLVAKLFDMSHANEATLSNVLIQEILKFKATQSDCLRLAGDLLRGATMVYTPQMKLFSCLEMLAGADSECQFISSATMLEVFTEFTDFEKTRCLVVLLGVIQRHRTRLGCSFNKFKDCEELASIIVNLFGWFVAALNQLIEYDNGPETCQAIMATINVAQQYINDPFIFKVLQIVGRTKKIAGGSNALKSEIEEPLLQWKNSSVLFFKEIGELHSRFIRVFEPPDPLPHDYVRRTVQKLRRPGIRSLTSVLVSFRVLMPAKEVAETIMMFGTLHGYDGDALLLDFLQACVLIMLEEHENHDSRHHSVLFFFAKLPKILECFLQKQFITRDVIQSSLSTIIEKYRHELDAVDFTLKDNSIKTLVGELCKLNVIKEDCAQKLQTARMDQIKPNIDLHQLIIKHEASNDKQVLMIMTTKKLKNSLETVWDHNDKFFIMISKIVSSGVTLFDFCCSAYCVNGDLSELTRRIATLSRNAEMKKDPNRIREYLNVFTITFSLLARVSFNFPSLSIEELVAGKNGKDEANVKSSFYVWTKKMVKKIVPTKSKESGADADDRPGTSGEGIKTKEEDSSDVPMETEERTVKVECVSEPLRTCCLNLAQRQVFWDCSRTSLYEILELVPKIGSVWLEEFRNERKSPEKSKSEFQNIIYSFNELPVMLLCLAQWLESEPESHQRFLMSRCILEVLEDYVPDANAVSDKNVWSFVRSVVRLHLEEIQAAPPILHPVSIYLKSIATRTLPQCLRLQIPDLNILKDGWIYAQRQNWFNQRTLVLIDHMNRAKQHRSWIKLLVNNMMKLEIQDHMGKAIELICSTLLLDPVRSIIVALEILFDFLLSRDESADPGKPGLQHQCEYVIPLVKLVVQILMMGIWIVDMAKAKEGVKEPPEKIGRKSSETEKGSVVELDEADRVDTLYKTIGNCIACMMKESMNAVYTPVTSIVFHILNMIARSPDCRSKVLLIQMVPHEMLFRMAMLDPRIMSLEVFRQFCDPSKTEHDQAQLQFLCLLRRSGGL